MVKLRWLQVNKFRSVKPGTRLTFNDGHNVLLGQNGTGKTTLLNLVAAAIRSDFTEFQGLEFELQYELVSAEATTTLSVQNRRRASSLATAWEALPQQVRDSGILVQDKTQQVPVLSAEINLAIHGANTLLISIEGSKITARQGDGSSTIPFDEHDLSPRPRTLAEMVHSVLTQQLLDKAFQSQALKLFPLFMESQLRRFDESLEYFNRFNEFRPEVRRDPHGTLVFSGHFPSPRELWTKFGEKVGEHWGEDRFVLEDNQLPFLQSVTRILDFEKAEAAADLQETSKTEDLEVLKLGNLKFFFSHRGGWRISDKYLSYGQKRMLAFMYYLSTVESVAIADELVNGLHHRWIRACFEALGQRQVFLTSQNPLLLDYLNFQSPEDVRSTFVLCRLEKGPEQMVWENMTQEAAEDFFASYKVGFQQVGELLQSKGLW